MQQVAVTSEMEEAIGVRPLEAWLRRDLVCILPHENDVINASPDFDKVKSFRWAPPEYHCKRKQV